MDQQYVQQLQSTLAGTMQPDKQRQAEAYLKQLSTQHPSHAQFVPALLKIVCDAAADLGVRQAAAIKFKNCITKGWEYHDDHPEIPEGLKVTLRGQMIDIMCSVPSILQAQISEAVRVMAVTDFPNKWSDLLPRIVAKMGGSGGPSTIIGVLKTVHEIFKQFRNMKEEHENLLRLQAALKQFAEPLTQFYQRVAGMAMAAMQNKQNLTLLYEALTLMTEIFYSLNWYTIPEHFEDNMKVWMPAFRSFLSTKDNLGAIFAEPGNDDMETPREKLRCAIVSCISIYAEKYEEEFQPYFATFLGEVVKLLIACPHNSRFGSLVINGLGFLSQAVLKKVHVSTFGAPGFLRSLVQQVIYPNITMHQSDVEEFEDNPEEFIRRDIEGSDKFTRRKSASDLLRNLRRNFDSEITSLVLMVVQSLLQKFAANPAQQAAWIGKETAVQMYMAVAIVGYTSQKGVATDNINKHIQSKVNVETFFRSYILKDLREPRAHPVLKAAALKFTTIFRQQLASPAVLPVLLPALVSESVVVHTYAANCLERTLVIRDQANLRISAAALAPHSMTLLNNLFTIVENPVYPDNEYVMRAIMRVISVADAHIAGNGGFVQTLCQKLCGAVNKLIKVSTSPKYNHYVFDALAALVHSCCHKNKAMVPIFMKVLLPVFQPILGDGGSDFYPYALQMLAQLLSFATPGAPLEPLFQQLLDSLMLKEMWVNRGLIPATVQLLQVYFRVAPAHLVKGGYHIKILNIFQSLLRKRATEEYSLMLVQTLLSCLPLDALKPFLPKIMEMIAARLQDKRKQGSLMLPVRHIVVATSCVIYHVGILTLAGPYFKAYVSGFLGFFSGKFSPTVLKASWQVPAYPLPQVITEVRKYFLCGKVAVPFTDNSVGVPGLGSLCEPSSWC